MVNASFLLLDKPHPTCPRFETILCLHDLQCFSCKKYTCSLSRHTHPPCPGYDLDIVPRAIFQQHCELTKQQFQPTAPPISLFWFIIVTVGYSLVFIFYRLKTRRYNMTLF